ncbi:winged helix DNA-binding domain-containing protein [Saccharothrix sp. 6-C]|uniref:DNA glycosylase AlkZ-like family protein n=1 Tax=Saccharothrix sp. 6-C TaxID=2781735 RepID=UPI0019179FEA|nr:crosslink repair DNA glycosylase YcaQ family protein [Saccharothrix sp. 6-C]QQQ77210.1 winged helix DNA-binding domain-containing protein [Saccharothrix sp. 6-C]
MADRERVIAYRVAAHQFDRTVADASGLRVFDLGLQDSERSAVPALAARLEQVPELDAFTLTWSVRGAPHWHRADEVPALAARLWPLSDADAVARMNRPPVEHGREVLHEVASALREVVTEPMTKGEASARLTAVVRPDVAAWCRGCDATHVLDPVFRLAVLPAGLRFDPAEKTVTFVPLEGRRDVPRESAGFPALISDYLRLHGPAGPSEVAHYFGAPVREVKDVWPDDLVAVSKRAWLPADRMAAFENPPEPEVVRLLPPLDPYLNARDRDLLVPDKAHQKQVWRILGRRGALLVDGEILGTWQARATGSRLDVEASPFVPLDVEMFAEEATRLAAARGLAEAKVR